MQASVTDGMRLLISVSVPIAPKVHMSIFAIQAYLRKLWCLMRRRASIRELRIFFILIIVLLSVDLQFRLVLRCLGQRQRFRLTRCRTFL